MKTMRRTLALLLSLTLIVTCTIAGVVLPTSAEETEVVNLIPNGDFEGFGEETPVVKPWTPGHTGASWEIAEGNGINGSWGIKNLAASGFYLDFASKINLEEGATYRLSYKAKTNDKKTGGTGTARVYLNGVKNVSFVNNSGQSLGVKAYAKEGQWISYRAEFVAKADAYVAAKDSILLEVGANGVGMCFDDFEIVKLDDPTNRDILVGGDFEGAVDSALFGGDSLDASYTMLSHSSKTMVDTDPDDKSNKVMVLKGDGTKWSGAYMRGVHIPGTSKTYLLTFDYKGGSWSVYNTDTKITYGVASPKASYSVSASATWKPYGVVINAISDMQNWLFDFQKNTTDQAAAPTYIDNMRLIEYHAPESVAMSESAVTAEYGSTKQLGVTITPETATMPFFKWTTSNKDVATVDQTGKVTVVAPGEATITAKADGFDAITCTVTVPRPEATAIQLNMTETTVVQSGYIELIPTALPEFAELPAITWTSSNEKVAKVADGIVTGVKVGTATITATAEGLVPVTCEVTVHNDAVYIADLEDANDTKWTYNGETGVQTVDPADEDNHVVAVDAANKMFLTNAVPCNVKKGDRFIVRLKIKQIGTTESYASRADLVFAWYNKTGGFPSDYYVTWGSNDGNGVPVNNFVADKWNTVQHIVTAPDDNTSITAGVYFNYIASGVSFLFDDLEIIKINEDVNLMANGDFEENTAQHYMYRHFLKSSVVEEADGNHVLQVPSGNCYFQTTGTSSAYAYELTFRYKSSKQLAPYTPNGTMLEPYEGYDYNDAVGNPNKLSDVYAFYYPATTGNEWGYAKYYFRTHSAQYGLAFSTGATVTVDDIVLRELDFATGMELDKAEAEVFAGETVELSATPVPEGSYFRPVVWTSSDDSIATVADGVVTTKGVGEVTITATARTTTNTYYTQTCVINVKPVAVTDVTLDAEEVILTVEGTHTLAATVLPDNATDKTVTWTSSNDAVATVTGGVITAVGAGVATITAKAGDVEDVCTVTVRAKDYPIIGGELVGTVGEPSGFTYVTDDETTNGTDVLLEGDETDQYIKLPARGNGAVQSPVYDFDFETGVKYDLRFNSIATGSATRIKWTVYLYKEGKLVETLTAGMQLRTKTAGTDYRYNALFKPNKNADSFSFALQVSPHTTTNSGTVEPCVDSFKLTLDEEANIKVPNGDLEDTSGKTGTTLTFKGTHTKDYSWCEEENGNHYLKLTAIGSGHYIQLPKITGNFKSGVRYILRVKVKNASPDVARVCIYSYLGKQNNDSDPVYTDRSAGSTGVAAASDWTEYQFVINSYKNSTKENGFYCYLVSVNDTNGDGEKTAEIWLDDFRLEEAPVGDSSVNLMPDSECDTGSQVWEGAFGSYSEITTDPDDETNTCIKFTKNSSGKYLADSSSNFYLGQGIVSDGSVPEIGQIYKLTYWQKGPGVVTLKGTSYFEILKTEGNPNKASDDWKKITVYYRAIKTNAPSSTSYISFKAGGGDVYVDKAELREVANALEVSMENATLVPGQAHTITFTTYPELSYHGTMTYSLDVAKTVASIDSDTGVVTALQGTEDINEFTLTATSDTGVSATATYTIEYRRNLIVGGDFEDASLNSTAWNGHTSKIVEDSDGNMVLKIDEAGGETGSKYNARYYKGHLYFQPNATYRMSYKVKGQGKVALAWTNATGVSVSGDSWFESATEVTEWQEKVVYITTGAAPRVSLKNDGSGTLNQGWQFHTRDENKTGDVVYFDDIRITLTGFVDVPTDVENGSIEVEATKGVAAETEVTVEVTPDEGYIMKPGSLKYTTPDGKVYKVLNKELKFNPENFGSREFTGDTFTFTMPKDSVALDAEFIPTTEQNFAMDTVGTGLRQKADGSYDGIRFLTRMNLAFSFNDVADAAELELGLKYNGKDYTVKEIGSMIVRDNGAYDLGAMDPTNESTYWRKSVAYKAGANMTLLDYTNRYIDFTVVVTKGANIEEEDFAARRYTAQGYLILTNSDGDIVVKCDNALTNSVNGAKGIVA